jgi:hypothetical protein
MPVFSKPLETSCPPVGCPDFVPAPDSRRGAGAGYKIGLPTSIALVSSRCQSGRTRRPESSGRSLAGRLSKRQAGKGMEVGSAATDRGGNQFRRYFSAISLHIKYYEPIQY